jgi:hypothetical protein
MGYVAVTGSALFVMLAIYPAKPGLIFHRA